MEEKYIPNTVDQIGHYFGNYVAPYRLLRQMSSVTEEMATETQNEFITGLEKTIKGIRSGKIIVLNQIDEEQIRKMIDTSNRIDWRTAEGLKELHKVYGEIIGKQFNSKFIEGIV